MLRLGWRNGEIVGIGSLEARVLRALYEQEGWVKVATVLDRLMRDTQIDRSSVITCLKRMADKGYLNARKDKQGAWSFRPALSAYEFGLTLIQNVWENLWGPPPSALSRFVTDALTGKLGEEDVPEEMKEVGRQTDGLSQLVKELSATGTKAAGEDDIAGAPAAKRPIKSRPQRARVKMKRVRAGL
jgi:predicted transcriptional regulator